jgi:hypothetical protein
MRRQSVTQDLELHREVALKQIQEQHADNSACRMRLLLETECGVPLLSNDAGGGPTWRLESFGASDSKLDCFSMH